MKTVAVIGFQQFTSTVITTAVVIAKSSTVNTTTGTVANAALVSIGGSTGAVRFRDDGTAPTSNIGMRLPAGTVPYLYQGDLQKIAFIADSVPGNADVNLAYVQVVD